MEARPTVDSPPARLEDADSRHAPAAAFRPTAWECACQARRPIRRVTHQNRTSRMRISRPPKLPQRGAGDEALRPRRQTSKHKRVRAARPGSARLSLLDPTLPHPQGCFPSSRAAHVTPFASYPSSPCSSRKPAASARGFSISNSLCHSPSGHPGLHCQR